MGESFVDIAPQCTALDVTKFSSLRILKASIQRLDEQELQSISWLGLLVALPQLTRVVLIWGYISPCKFLMPPTNEDATEVYQAVFGRR